MASNDRVTGVAQRGQRMATGPADQAINSAINSAVGSIVAVPDSIKKAGQQALTLATDIGNIVSSGAALIQAAGGGNAGFLTVPALAALTAAHIAALKNLGSQLDAHGQALGGAARSYATTEDAVRAAADARNAANLPLLQADANLLTTVRQDTAAANQQVGTLAANAREA